MSNAYVLDKGIFRPATGVQHREEHYDSAGFDSLRKMQEQHFWYRGRHRFLWHAVRTRLNRDHRDTAHLRTIDLGGGCGGWIKYATDHGLKGSEVALGDSSSCALEYAREILPSFVTRYQIDLLQLDWNERWDVAFLLDVLEHIPDHEEALRQIHRSLTPGGLLYVTTPALQRFWSYNDELAHHVRRYSKNDFERLAAETGFELLSSRYFMFFLSPLLLASRWMRQADVEQMTTEERHTLLERTHEVPGQVANALLSGVFNAETPIGNWVPFPWGTSILAVMSKQKKS